MRSLSLLLLAVGCSKGKPRREDPDTAAPPDTAEPAQTGDSAPADTGDTAGDTGAPEPCAAATFTAADGAVADLTAIFLKGDYYTFTEPGALTFCPGAWHVHLIAEADLSIVGLGETREETVLSGGESGTVIAVAGSPGAPVEVSIANVTIERGVALGSGNEAAGGGVRCEDGVLTIDDTLLRDNHAYDGGGVYASGCATAITRSEFVDNSGQDDGGATSFYRGEAALEEVLFQGNAGQDGAAILMYDGPLAVMDSVFEGNTSTYHGGGVVNYYGATTIEGSIFLDNYAETYGGALALYGGGTIEGCRFEGNGIGPGGLGFGGVGGAIYYGGGLGGGGSALEGAACDFVANTPDDLGAVSGQGESLGKGASFLCSGSTCAAK